MTRPRLALAASVLGLAALTLASIAADAGARRARFETGDAARLALARRTGHTDLALSSTSRWLRHPSLSEPAAACAESPVCLDQDPAGAALGPARSARAPGPRTLSRSAR